MTIRKPRKSVDELLARDVYFVKCYIRNGHWWWVFRYRNGRRVKVLVGL